MFNMIQSLMQSYTLKENVRVHAETTFKVRKGKTLSNFYFIKEKQKKKLLKFS